MSTKNGFEYKTANSNSNLNKETIINYNNILDLLGKNLQNINKKEQQN